jgi:hypothetical protein
MQHHRATHALQAHRHRNNLTPIHVAGQPERREAPRKPVPFLAQLRLTSVPQTEFTVGLTQFVPEQASGDLSLFLEGGYPGRPFRSPNLGELLSLLALNLCPTLHCRLPSGAVKRDHSPQKITPLLGSPNKFTQSRQHQTETAVSTLQGLPYNVNGGVWIRAFGF